MVFLQGCTDIRETLLIPLEITPVELMHPKAVKMEHAQRDVSLLHALDKGSRRLLVVVCRKGGGQPQAERPRRRKCRTSGQLRILSHDILRIRTVEQVIFDPFARNGKSHILYFLAGNLKRNFIRAVHENTISIVCHIERYAFIGNLRRRASVLIPGIHNLSVFDKRCETFAKAINALAHLQGQLADHIRLIIFAHIVVRREHGALLAVPSHISQIAEAAAGQDFSVRLKGIAEVFTLHAHLYLAGIQDSLVLIHRHADIFINPLFLLKAGNIVVVRLVVPCLHGNRVRGMCNKLNGNRRKIQRRSAVHDLFRRRQNSHTAWNLLYLIRLHRVRRVRLLAWQPVTLCKFHTILSFRTDVSVLFLICLIYHIRCLKNRSYPMKKYVDIIFLYIHYISFILRCRAVKLRPVK